jgi:hypothetical protein
MTQSAHEDQFITADQATGCSVAADPTQERTGHTAAEQAMYWRGFEEAQLNAQHNAKVRADAPDTPRPSWLDGGADAVAMAREDGLLPAASPASTVADEGSQPAAYLTLDDEESPCMLFFDLVEARTYCEIGEEPEPLYRRPAPAAGDALDWTLISELLPEIPADAPGKRIHVLAGRYFGGHWYSWSMWYGPRGAELRFYEEFTDEDADGDDVELIKDDDCATHWRYMPAGPALSASQQGGE